MAGQSVLVVAAHPDDELLGVAGTIRKHVLAGDTVHSMVLCEGETVRYHNRDVPQEEFGQRAADILGMTVQFYRYPDQNLEDVHLVRIIKEIEREIEKRKVTTLYTQFGGDVNLDHKRLFDAVLVAARPMRTSLRVVYAFETCSSTEWGWPQQFQPDTWVDISDTLEDKIAAMACYESELLEWPHPRSLESLRHRAHYFGSQAIMKVAEPFITVRRYVRPDDEI